ncbi:MAG TPA: hypothetical protein VGR89_03110 [Puia sp.]|nr:hypothetical protein [Puia sp.]
MSFIPFIGNPNLNLQAATPLAGVALINGTPTILSWTAPNDGVMHRFAIMADLHVTTLEVGGAVNNGWTAPDGTAGTSTIFAAAQAAGIYRSGIFGTLIQPGSTVTVFQTALTGGASLLWAEIWGY